MPNTTAKPTFLKTEILAGFSVFLTMVYIAFVNPSILREAGMDYGAVFTATCVVTAFACFIMGCYAKAPIAVAPGMALNIYFSYTVVQAMAVPWRQALAMVFVAGLLFLVTTLTPLRRLLIDAIPANLQRAIVIGISLLIALIALRSSQIVVGVDGTLLGLGVLYRPEFALFFLGFLLIATLDYYRVPGAIVISILVVSVLSLIAGLTHWRGLVALPPSISPTFLQLDFSGLTNIAALKGVFTFFLIAVFDATGTLLGLLSPSLFNNQKDYQRGFTKSLTVSAAASTFAGLVGCASTAPFIESAAGIEAGGRTGVVAITVACCFILLLFFFPLAQIIPSYAVGPALLYVACCMMKQVNQLVLTDISEMAPCILTILIIPFTSSIANGIGCGVIIYVLIKTLTRQKIARLLYGLALLFLVFFWVG